VDYLEKTAVVSADTLYRYVLTRLWNPDRGTVVFCMLNPSVADAEQDDRTLIRCVNFADGWGYGRVVLVNLFAFRATYPGTLRRAKDPVGPDNDRHILEQCAGRVVVAAWGATVQGWPEPKWSERARVVRQMVGRAGMIRHLGLTKGGHPQHPLRLRADLVPMTFPEASE
jgi:hypothetical protein